MALSSHTVVTSQKGMGMSEGLRKGFIKWFNVEKGYGFLVVDGYQTDIFLHVKKLRNSGIITNPAEGECYECVVETGPKGLYASNLTKIVDQPGAIQ